MISKIKNAFLALVAAAAGLFNALLGAGGGILLSLTIGKFFSDRFPERSDIYVNSQAAMIPGCALSCLLYSYKGLLDVQGFSLLAVPAAVGGAVGSFLLPKIKSTWIQILFSVIVIWSGARMLLG